MAVISIEGFMCERCGHTWPPRDIGRGEGEMPKLCPRCKSPYWNKPRKGRQFR